MGHAMAGRLLTAGHVVHVYNRTAARAESLALRGATAFATPKSACRGVDAVVVLDPVPWLGAGTRDALRSPAPALPRCAGDGLPDAAAAGTLTLLVGAAGEDLHLARSVLDALASRVVHFGPVGAGTAYKLMINLIGAVQIASIAEGLAIAERAGLDLALVGDAIASGQAASPQVVRNTRRMLAGDHDRNIVFTAALRLKDVEYGLELASSLGIGAPFGALAASAYRQLCAMGYAPLNESKIIEVSRLHTG